jgi:hypothetical protein
MASRYHFRPGQARPVREPLPTPVAGDLNLVYTENFRRDLVELSPDQYARAVRLVIGLPARHLNDPQRLRARDSRVVTLDDDSGLRLTYIIVLSLGELILARLDRTDIPGAPCEDLDL